MGTIDLYRMTDAELQATANHVKEVLLATLQNEGVIQDAGKLCEEYAVIIARKGLLGRMIDKLRGYDGETARIEVVRMLNQPARGRGDS